MSRKLLNFLFFLNIYTFVFVKCEEFEYHLATKTAYRNVANYDSTEIQYEGCVPKKTWAFIRHGTRNPSLDDIDDITSRLPEIKDLIMENLPQGTDRVNDTVLDMFRQWQPQVTSEDEELLTSEGEEELFLLAQRYHNRLPTLLTDTYDEAAYYFKYAISERTEVSCKRFADGLFGPDVTETINFPQPLEIDPVLEFYKLCTKWMEEVRDNEDATIERTKFEKSSEMKQTKKNVNSRLNLKKKKLKHHDVRAIYKTCAYETAWNKTERSPWCLILDEEDFEVLEYEEDLKYYWTHGYGYEVTYQQACVPINDLINFFKNKALNPKATLYFTHSGALVKTLSYLGLYEEANPLLAEDFDKNSKRKYRTSHIDSFANNLFFVLFDCQDTEKVLALHQEQPVRLPSCPESDLCDLNTFIQYYGSFECNFDEICGNNVFK